MRWFYRMLQLWFEAVLGRILSRNRGLPLRVSAAAPGKEILIAAVLALTLMGCGQPVTHIDWVDFVQFGQVQYLAVDYGGWTGGRPLTDRDLGPEFAKVRNKLAGNVRNPGYRSQDGDAAFLDAGTPVYAVNGYEPGFRLVARRDGRLILYEADTNATAKTGADLMDIEGRVRSIRLNSAEDGVTELAAVTDPQQVADLVELVLNAPVNQNHRDQTGTMYFIAFHLEDDTIVSRAYWPDSGELSRGILLPPVASKLISRLR